MSQTFVFFSFYVQGLFFCVCGGVRRAQASKLIVADEIKLKATRSFNRKGIFGKFHSWHSRKTLHFIIVKMSLRKSLWCSSRQNMFGMTERSINFMVCLSEQGALSRPQIIKFIIIAMIIIYRVDNHYQAKLFSISLMYRLRVFYSFFVV